MTDGLRARESSWGSEYVLQRSVYTVTPLVEGGGTNRHKIPTRPTNKLPACIPRNAYVVVRSVVLT